MTTSVVKENALRTIRIFLLAGETPSRAAHDIQKLGDPSRNAERCSLFGLPPTEHVTFGEAFLWILYEAARRYQAGGIFFLHLVGGSINLTQMYGVDDETASVIASRFSTLNTKGRDLDSQGTAKLLVAVTNLVLGVLFRHHPATSGANPSTSLTIEFARNILGMKTRYSGGVMLPSFEELKARFDAALLALCEERQQAAAAGCTDPVCLSGVHALSWCSVDSSVEDSNQPVTSNGARIMNELDCFGALADMAEHIEKSLQHAYVDVSLGITDGGVMGSGIDDEPRVAVNPEVTVKEHILDFGEGKQARVMAIYGCVTSPDFHNRFLMHVRNDLRFAAVSSGSSRMGRVSSRIAGQIFEVSGNLYKSFKFSPLEEELCRIGIAVMQPANALIKETCLRLGLKFNKDLLFDADMMHMSHGPHKDSGYWSHSDSGCLLDDDMVPEELLGGRGRVPSSMMQVLTFVFSDALESDGVWLEWTDGGGDLLGKILCTGSLIHYQGHLVQQLARHQVKVVGANSGVGSRLVVTLRLTSKFQSTRQMLHGRLTLLHAASLRDDTKWITSAKHK